MEISAIDNKISEFLKEHHVLTMASYSQTELWCANLFYAYDPLLPGFVVTSDDATKHITMATKEDSLVAGSVVLETEKIGMIRGLQFKAKIEKAENSEKGAWNYRKQYLLRFPYAVLSGSELWLLRITELKYTDNRLGFGKKIIWKIDD